MNRWASLLALLAFLAVGDRAQPAEAPAAPTQSLWHLPVSPSLLRVTGEAGAISWPVYVPPGSAASLKTFQLGYQAAIEVMPEASWITLYANGQAVGRVPITSPSGVKTVAIDLPAGVLQPGWNALAIDITQRHRVDCSLASTYELWTQIDPARTGLLGAQPRIAAFADLAALPVDSDGATRLHLLLSKDANPADLGRAVTVTERIALRAHLAHPVVDTTPSRSGLNIAVGMPAALAGLAGLPAKTENSGLGTTTDGAPLLVVSGGTEAELDRAIEQLGNDSSDPVGTDEGLRVLSRVHGAHLRPGNIVSFADLGLPTRTFSGRLLRQSFDLVLPPDSYPGDYGEARLTLDGGYAAGLAPGARLLVRVNGVIDGNLEFDRGGGAVLQGEIIHMPLSPFRPGRNRIEFEAQLPAKVDQTCDTLNSIGAKERVLLLGTSTLSLPPLARVAQFPGLSASFSGNWRITPSVPPRVFLPRATDGSLSAAATLLTNAAVATGAPSGAVYVRGLPQTGTQPAIVVADASDLPGPLLASAGVDPNSVAAAWGVGGRVSATSKLGGAGDQPRNSSDFARLDAWGNRVDTNDGWLGGATAWTDALTGAFTHSLRQAGLLGHLNRTLTITGDTTFVLAQNLLDDIPLTVVTARDDQALSLGAAALTDPNRLASLHGRALSLEADAAGTTIIPAEESAFYRTQAFSLVNDRLIAAGWVSSHAGWYLAAVLLAAVSLGVSTWAYLVIGRGSPAS